LRIEVTNEGKLVATQLETKSRQATAPESAMVDVAWMATALGCSERHVHRMRDAGLMPAPVKLGSLVRWSRKVIEKWIADGCPAVRKS
jgi:predicted DNA-binding transcriptional regulator AlpA